MNIKKQKLKYKNYGFTLVELIIVITILAILATIAFVSFQGYSKDSRDTIRVSDLNSISKGLDIYKVQTGNYPMPDDSVNVTANGDIIGYQGNIGDNISRLISLKGGKDPLDRTYYTYYLSSDKKNIQLLGLGENQQLVAGISNLLGKTYADNSNRYPITRGTELGIILDKNKTPIQQLGTGGLDVMTATGEYIGVKSNTKIITGTGIILKDLNPNYLVKTLGGSGAEIINSSNIDINGNIIIIGYYANDNTDINKVIDFNGDTLLGKSPIVSNDAFITKLDSKGNKLWTKTLGGSGSDYLYSVVSDSFGNLYIGGVYLNSDFDTYGVKDFNGGILTGVTVTNSYDIFLAKLDSNGNQQWIKTLGGHFTEGLYPTNSLIINNGSLYLGGTYENNNIGASGSGQVRDFAREENTFLLGKSGNQSIDGFVVKLDLDGNQQWIKTLGGGGTDRVYYLSGDNNGNIYVGGAYGSNNSYGENVIDFSGSLLNGLSTSSINYPFVAKLDSNGNQKWIKALGGNKSQGLSALFSDIYGNTYVGGTYNNDSSDVCIVKDFDGNPLLGYGSGSGTVNRFLSKLNTNGVQEWINTSLMLNITSIVVDNNQKLYLGGNYLDNNTNSSVYDFSNNLIPIFGKSNQLDGYVMKMNPNSGVQEWIKIFGGLGLERVDSMISDNNGNLYIGARYHNNISNINGTLDIKGYPVLGKSSNSAISGAPDVLFQKLFKKDLE